MATPTSMCYGGQQNDAIHIMSDASQKWLKTVSKHDTPQRGVASLKIIIQLEIIITKSRRSEPEQNIVIWLYNVGLS